MNDSRKNFVVRLASGVRLMGTSGENVTLEEEGSVVRVKGLLMRNLGFFTFYTPEPLSIPEHVLASVEEEGREIFSL